ncbi:hypothetical protein GCM10010112_26230 [Actinoplanes lobatus]|uniref:Adenylate cyclase class 2 n=1 Tax=Actinoplanes lobatus TaxID=113568 RepID=A0A7W7HJH7_9ACTN|nr:class IV adenylate cyclase [Actinoplanes lobatus]MBB4751664.1 adenylate cyclase class 2 [Actinoplanes lobatus]GGN65197.1 hypothetical protein GCM10010112_26230 [Actinoplanes lobatus]GIE43247.1 hypothetical protein Alo02nite_61450 [Actinoplanes lobatus]
MIEAELKARLADPATVRDALAEFAEPEMATYRDTYYDTADGSLDRAGRELRVRTVETVAGVRHLLTYKEPAVDAGSGSKPEYETTLADPAAVAYIIEALGYPPATMLTKDCENFRFDSGGRSFLATVVRVPELDGTFLEVETQALEEDLAEALDAVRAVLADLGVDEGQLTTELYTEAVRAARADS